MQSGAIRCNQHAIGTQPAVERALRLEHLMREAIRGHHQRSSSEVNWKVART